MPDHPVLSAEQRRAAALMARDPAALAACLHDELVYVHATGARPRNDELLQLVETGPAFIDVDFAVQQLVELDAAVLLHGELRMRLCGSTRPMSPSNKP